MLFFVDESWQTISGRRVGALGAVAIAQSEYNAFCGEVFAIKRQVLGADELSEHELKGQNALGKGQFKRQAQTGRSAWIDAVDQVFEALAKHQARIFVVWTTSPRILTLRHPGTTELSAPYKALLYDFRAYMRDQVGGSLGSLNFDQRGMKEDEAAACAVSNYLFRTRGDWREHFLQIPNFTVSSVSPGLQAADLIAYLGAHQSSRTARPELGEFVSRIHGLRYEYRVGGRAIRTIRRVSGGKRKEPAGRSPKPRYKRGTGPLLLSNIPRASLRYQRAGSKPTVDRLACLNRSRISGLARGRSRRSMPLSCVERRSETWRCRKSREAAVSES